MDRVTAARGEITEVVGRPSSGRTSFLLACLCDVAQSGETAALVDTEETFDPASAAQAGGALRPLLWVRCGTPPDRAPRPLHTPRRFPGVALVPPGLRE